MVVQKSAYRSKCPIGIETMLWLWFWLSIFLIEILQYRKFPRRKKPSKMKTNWLADKHVQIVIHIWIIEMAKRMKQRERERKWDSSEALNRVSDANMDVMGIAENVIRFHIQTIFQTSMILLCFRCIQFIVVMYPYPISMWPSVHLPPLRLDGVANPNVKSTFGSIWACC